MITGSWTHRISIAVKTIFIAVCFSEMIESVITLCLKLSGREMLPSLSLYVVAEVVLLALWFGIYKLKLRNNKDFGLFSGTFLRIALSTLTFALLLIISGFEYAQSAVGNQFFSVFASVLSVLSYLGIGILGLFVMYINANFPNFTHSMPSDL